MYQVTQGGPALQLVSSSNPRLAYQPGRDMLRAFLAAELAPGLTVEEACYPCLFEIPLEEQPSVHEVMHGRLLLEGAGIFYCVVDTTEPGYVMLDDPELFAKRFPRLQHLIPFVLQSQGVWVRSNGVPVAGGRRAPALAVIAGGEVAA